jgi:Xaa-Pro aminopeptidase
VSERIDRLRAALEEPLLVTNPVSVRYLTGFVSSNPALLVDDERVTLYTDFRYAETAAQVEGVEFVQLARAIHKDLPPLLPSRVGFEADYVTYGIYEHLATGQAELVPRHGLVEALRAIKDEEELKAIRAASSITSKAYERLAGEPFVGRTERELAWRMEQLFHELGADAPAFETIVASGENGARPHTEPGDRRIGEGELVVIDAGCALGGYCSDCTRTFATGALPERLQEIYDVCLNAQKAALEQIRPGVTGPEADAAARDPIAAAGFGDAFGHGLGHGVGLMVHEGPRLAETSEDTLVPGNVVTVEPGIYLSGLGGVRIEDLVVVTDDGPEVLTSFTKELVTVN